MARSRDDIKQIMFNAYVTERAAAGLPYDDPESWSVNSIKRIWVNTVSYMCWIIESIFDLFESDVDTKLGEMKPMTGNNYERLALNFQYGFDLLPDSDLFDNTGYTEQEIEDSKVVKYAALIKTENAYGRIVLKLKIAGSNGTDLIQLDNSVVNAVQEYFDRAAAAAGDKIVVSSSAPDKIKVNARCFYDPLILDETGNRRDGSASDVVRTAVKTYLSLIKYSGTYVPEFHEDYVEDVKGVVAFKIDQAQVQYGILPFVTVDFKHIPDAGWMRFNADADLVITYIPQSPIQ